MLDMRFTFVPCLCAQSQDADTEPQELFSVDVMQQLPADACKVSGSFVACTCQQGLHVTCMADHSKALNPTTTQCFRQLAQADPRPPLHTHGTDPQHRHIHIAGTQIRNTDPQHGHTKHIHVTHTQQNQT